MSRVRVRILAKPSKEHDSNSLKLVEQTALFRSRKKEEFKYIMYGFRKLGDPLIDSRKESEEWTYPQDVELEVLCQAKEKQCVTCADIKISHSSTQYDAQIIDGGIGQNHIHILLRVQNTYWFKYEVHMYGRNVLQEIEK